MIPSSAASKEALVFPGGFNWPIIDLSYYEQAARPR